VELIADSSPAILASFALRGHAMGVPLPSGRFTDPGKTVASQWQAYIAGQCGQHNDLALDLEVCTDETGLRVVVSTSSNLNVFRLKPVIEQLNAVSKGMGWFVVDAIYAIEKHGYPLYLPSTMGDYACYLWHQGCTTDKEFARELRHQQDNPKRWSLEKLKEHHDQPWPSDLDAAVEGHTWLLKRYYHDGVRESQRAPGWRKPAIPSRAEVLALLGKRDVDPLARAVLKAADDLLVEVECEAHPLADVGGLSSEELQAEFGWHGDEENVDILGATGIVVWDDPDTLLEALEHWEEYQMQGGDATTTVMVIRAKAGSDQQMATTVNQLKALVRRHALASRLLSFFKKEY